MIYYCRAIGTAKGDQSVKLSGRDRSGAALIAMIVLFAGLAPLPAVAEGDLAKRAERLEPLQIKASSGFSVRQYRAKTGQFYRWRIESDGGEEYELVAPELFRNSWIQQVSIDGREVKASGLYSVEFDSKGPIDVWFVPIRPGTFEYSVKRLESQGFKGAFVVE
jgi:hypothetical protein